MSRFSSGARTGSYLTRGSTLSLMGILFLWTQPGAHAGTISGEARFNGALPDQPVIQLSKDQDYCGRTLPNESYLIGPNRGLKNVVIYIDRPPGQPVASRKENILDNQGCRFAPRVLAMAWGERLIVKNSDPKLHIVHAYSEQRTVFSLSLPFRGLSVEATHKIRRPALLQLNCDTHSWMRGHIHVFGHPFFAVTGESGTFSIADVPAGRHTLKAWHEEAGLQSAEITVPERGEAKADFELKKKTLP